MKENKEIQCRDVYKVLDELKGKIQECIEVTNQKRDSVLTEQCVLDMLGIGAKTLRSYRINGLLAYSKIGNKFFYRQSDIERMIDKFRVEDDKSVEAYG